MAAPSGPSIPPALGIWPVGQAVKTPPFHGGNTGSSPVRVIVKHTNIVCMLFLFLLQKNVVESVDICCKYVILWM